MHQQSGTIRLSQMCKYTCDLNLIIYWNVEAKAINTSLSWILNCLLSMWKELLFISIRFKITIHGKVVEFFPQLHWVGTKYVSSLMKDYKESMMCYVTVFPPQQYIFIPHSEKYEIFVIFEIFVHWKSNFVEFSICLITKQYIRQICRDGRRIEWI